MPEITTDCTDKKSQITQIKAKIISNLNIKDRYFKLVVNSPVIAKNAQPGQFVNIKVNNCQEPLLRRPFSVHRVNGARIEILYEVVGKGTEILSQRKAGEYLDVIGPLGNGFDLRLAISDKRQAILVAGGMGVAPLLFLADKLVHSPQSIVHSYPLVLIGAKTKGSLLCEGEFRRLGCNVKVATNDGSKGFKGNLTDLLKKLLSTIDYRLSTIYACGPRPMLKEIANISKKYNIPAQISLEEHMPCGIGACLGCVVNTRNGYQRVCKEGPVFAADEIVWEDKDE